MNRRFFLQSAGVAALATQFPFPSFASPQKIKPVVISSGNGLKATARAMEMIESGSDALDAVIAGVNIVEDDPKDNSVGLGGLPNADGVVELDSSCMHGPSGRGGAVASLRNIKNPSKVARMVMERTDHVLLVGEGALRFAKMHGFKEEDLLTEESREAWVKWRETMTSEDDYLPEHDWRTAKDIGGLARDTPFTYGTINCNALDLAGNISGVTTTSGLSYKIPGRVGDSPILGAGLYVDNEIGAAGSTGRGEANLLSCASVMIVNWMAQGKSPEEACLLAAKRVVAMTKESRLLDANKRPTFNVNYYAINKKGEFGGASLWSGAKFAVNTGEKESRLVESAYLFKKEK